MQFEWKPRHKKAFAIARYLIVFIICALPLFLSDVNEIKEYIRIVINAFLFAVGIYFVRREAIAGIREWKHSARKFALLVAGGLLIDILINNIAIGMLLSLFMESGAMAQNQKLITDIMQIVWLPIFIVDTVIMGPILEECFFRYLLIGKAKAKIPVGICVAFSSILFAAAHMHGFSLADMLQAVPAFMSGILYGAVYAVSGNITLPTAIHILSNAIAVAFLLLI